MPRFYGESVAIGSCRGFLLYNLKKYTTNILKAYAKYEKNNAKNSTFSNYARNVPIEVDEIMVSFEVTCTRTFL